MRALFKNMLVAYFLVGILGPISINAQKKEFMYVKNQNLYTPNGKQFLIKGTNLGNWLNPEGYMFLFQGDASSYRLINTDFCEMVGEDFTNWFWREFKKNYITKEDVFYIKNTGMNTIRVPFHYKLFTHEDYMGLSENQNGFEILDDLIKWCEEAGLYVILDMHDAPGGQTGANIDDSYGFPWLMENKESQEKFISVWQKIAEHYANNPTILGYDLLNEPIATYFTKDYPYLNDSLEPLYKNCVKAIRKVDTNHIVLLGGAQWNGNFSMFTDWTFDNKLMYTCHRYGCLTNQAGIQDFLDFRDKVNLPMYMGETGENTDEWVSEFRQLLEKNNMGWTFWPYKKIPQKSCMLIIKKPENWDTIIEYTKKSEHGLGKVMANRPDPAIVKKAMLEFLENMKFENCIKNEGYIKALGMNP